MTILCFLLAAAHWGVNWAALHPAGALEGLGFFIAFYVTAAKEVVRR